jgi:glycine dehydrogenase subunit 1
MAMTDSNSQHFPYLPHTESDRNAMLRTIGVRSFEELISQIPKDVRAKELDLPAGMNEQELIEYISSLASKNKPTSEQSSFLGGGSYRRFVPSVVPAMVSRSEFATAYTPYQPEVSQGSLQAIYEFQTAVCLLTGMDVANASMYDGPTACAEAALMAARLTGRNKVLMSESVNPEYRMVTETYTDTVELVYSVIKTPKGSLMASDIQADESTAAVIVQYPNYFGCIEELDAIEKEVHARGALLIVVSEPISLGLLTPPGKFNADIVIGDAQPCGNYLSFGGPSAGYMATRKEYVRQLPGRLAGMTVDNRGQRAFTLTLQTREQHIRRAKATSNICTNQALNALAMLVYITMLGPQGLHDTAEVSVKRAHYLAERLCAIQGVSLLFDQPYFNEFALQLPRPAAEVLDELKQRGILGGIDISKFYEDRKNAILVAVTEMNSVQELENYISTMSEVLTKSAVLR